MIIVIDCNIKYLKNSIIKIPSFIFSKFQKKANKYWGKREGYIGCNKSTQFSIDFYEIGHNNCYIKHNL